MSAAAEAGAPAPKRAKAAAALTFNVNDCLDKAHEGESFMEIISLPPSALQGLADKADKALEAFKIHTIKDLAHWKFIKIARAIRTLSEVEEEGKRSVASEMNFNKAVDKAFETKSLKEIVQAPPSALQGLAAWADDTLRDVKITTIGELGDWKYARWAEALVTLADYENSDFASF